MKVGDLVMRTSEDLDKSLLIYLGTGTWQGWIRVYCPKESRTFQVRNTYVQEVDKKCP